MESCEDLRNEQKEKSDLTKGLWRLIISYVNVELEIPTMKPLDNK